MKKTMFFIVLMSALVSVGLLSASVKAVVDNRSYLPMVFKQGTTPTPTVTQTPTKTPTPKPPTPTPTNTPTYIPAEGGNTCVRILGAGRNSDGSTSMMGAVPSICSILVPYDVQMDGQLLIVRAERIKTDTWGCMEGDFGYWPPIDYSCPPPEQIFDEWGAILWGDTEYLRLPNSYKYVCGYCAECDPPYTTNCEEVYVPKD